MAQESDARRTTSDATSPGDGKSVTRRRLLNDAAKAAGGVCAGSLLLSLYAETGESKPAEALRPPGALPEPDFLSACVRCGLCVRACPYDTLRLAEFGDKVATGTPYFLAREVPCYMCKDIPCARACPTGALSPGLTDITAARMGLAALIDQENCLAFRIGQQCNICYRACPVRGRAITIERHVKDGYEFQIPTVHAEHCTGCGTCEKSCVLRKAAIKVFPPEMARGELGRNIRGAS